MLPMKSCINLYQRHTPKTEDGKDPILAMLMKDLGLDASQMDEDFTKMMDKFSSSLRR